LVFVAAVGFLADVDVIAHRVDIEIPIRNNVRVGVEQAERTVAQQAVAGGWVGVAEAEHRTLELVLAVAHFLTLSDVVNGIGIANDAFVKTETFACLHRAFCGIKPNEI
jgi:hypothetical protein